MQLSNWLREQIRINGGVLYYGEAEVALEKIAEELDRRLAGMHYSPRIVASNRIAVETLSTARANGTVPVEALQSCAALTRVAVESPKHNRGRPSKPRARVMNEMFVGLNVTGKYTRKELDTAKQEWIKKEFGCHPITYWRALALISQ